MNGCAKQASSKTNSVHSLGQINPEIMNGCVKHASSNTNSVHSLGQINPKIMNGCVKQASSKSNSVQLLDSSPLVWNKKVPNTQLEDFRKIVAEKYKITLNDYWDLHKWSVEHFENFWEEILIYMKIRTSRNHDKVFQRTGEDIVDVEWFPGLRFNAAEAFLSRRDDSIAIIYSDEACNDETFTFAQLYDEVKLYATAFRKHGVKPGDVISCCMTNRKEPVFIFLAALSIGAIFGGPLPYFGAKTTHNIVKKMEPKIYISIDHHVDNNIEGHNIDDLPEIVIDVPSIEKVIIVASKPETYSRNISNIPNSCFLRDFLKTGIRSDGTVQDIIFEQLPFNHPATIYFTSGTSGVPKGTVHSQGTVISELMNVVFYWDLKPGDVLFTSYAPGWTLWNMFVHTLAWGVTLFLYDGDPLKGRNGSNIWDIFAQYKVTYSLLITSTLDKLEKMDVKPDPKSDLKHLKATTTGASPVKIQNILYVKNNVKKDIFICSMYGATESFGMLTGIDFNSPSYAGENQVPGLGMNLLCYNSEGKSVVNERGEMVIATPVVGLPLYIWKDKDNKILKENYLSKYPGCYCQNDEIWINPKTKGIKVIGRSDDILNQYGERFGAGDIYSAIHDIDGIQDYVCVSQTNLAGDQRAVLFIKMKNGYSVTPEFKKKVAQKITNERFHECVPQVILETTDVPYNANNKRMESLVRKIIATNKIPEGNNIKNPQCLLNFLDIPELVDFMKRQK